MAWIDLRTILGFTRLNIKKTGNSMIAGGLCKYPGSKKCRIKCPWTRLGFKGIRPYGKRPFMPDRSVKAPGIDHIFPSGSGCP
jgi:hypothetical protein